MLTVIQFLNLNKSNIRSGIVHHFITTVYILMKENGTAAIRAGIGIEGE